MPTRYLHDLSLPEVWKGKFNVGDVIDTWRALSQQRGIRTSVMGVAGAGAIYACARNIVGWVAAAAVVTNTFNMFSDAPNANMPMLRSDLTIAHVKAHRGVVQPNQAPFHFKTSGGFRPDVYGTAIARPGVAQDCKVFDVQAHNDTNLFNFAAGTRTRNFTVNMCD